MNMAEPGSKSCSPHEPVLTHWCFSFIRIGTDIGPSTLSIVPYQAHSGMMSVACKSNFTKLLLKSKSTSPCLSRVKELFLSHSSTSDQPSKSYKRLLGAIFMTPIMSIERSTANNSR
jgi:hypothetical protein